jgi:putative ABC transport system permease protein
MRIRYGLVDEVLRMAWETLAANKLRSALTVLGVVIGVTSIVGMTSLIRGFDQSLRDSIRSMGPNTIFVAKFSGVSMSSGKEMTELFRRPNLTLDDARAIATQTTTLEMVDMWLGAAGPQTTQEHVFHGSQRTKSLAVIGSTERFADVSYIPLAAGRFFTRTEVQHRRNVVVLGQTPYQSLFEHVDPLGKVVRIGAERYTVVGVLEKRPSVGGFNLGQDDLVVIPYTSYQRQFGIRVNRARHGGDFGTMMIVAVPRDGVTREAALGDVERVMRIRHGLRVDEANDFDLVTQDAALRVWDQVSQATFLALVVISSIALMVAGIGVMAIMTITVTERTREIGVRKALGARRWEILTQFLAEAVFLTLMGGVLGIALGAAIGYAVHYFTRFPVSLPWWSFAIGIGFSASVGIVFGLFPAFRAARMDPIEALRYE